jgi:hypothetical protein
VAKKDQIIVISFYHNCLCDEDPSLLSILNKNDESFFQQ